MKVLYDMHSLLSPDKHPLQHCCYPLQ